MAEWARNSGQFHPESNVPRHLPSTILFLFFMSVCVCGIASQSGAWLEPYPSSLGPPGGWISIPRDSFFEVPASKLATVEFWLADKSSLAQENASYFGRADFKCSPGSALYLIRASYFNGGTGDFQIQWAGTTLVVSHGSLGTATNMSKSALVACLSKKPTAIYSSVSAAL